MEGTNIKYKDTSRNNDHTYIGNGCPNEWDSTDGTNKGGSPVSCSTNLAETYDSETQIIGVYYNYPASASGSSIGISGENIVVPDSFCPLGWQLPYSGTGGDYYDKSKSLAYLNGRYGYSSSAHGAQGMRSYPFSYILSGTYVNYIGALFFLDRAGDYWSNTYISPSTGAAGLNLYPISFNTTRGEDLAVGYTVRCVKFLASFIDGTVAGNPEDLRIYKETPGEYATHDHTYFGNGCATGNGSITPCATRIVNDGNNEAQKNGTYYISQAATSGSSGELKLENTNAPDTFCPLGWQLPYSGTGGDYYNKSRSWNYLFTAYGIGFNDGTAADSTKIKSYPFSYIYSGYFEWVGGLLYVQTYNGYYWSPTIVSGSNLNSMTTSSLIVRVANSSGKAAGFPLRCDFDISNLEKLSMASAFTH